MRARVKTSHVRARGEVRRMLKPPRLWDWMTREWCPLPARLAWVLWRALSQGTVEAEAVQWREQFLAFDREDRAVERRCGRAGFDRGTGHPLLFLDEAKVPNCRKNNGFMDLGNYSEWPKVAGAMIEATFCTPRPKAYSLLMPKWTSLQSSTYQ